MLTLFLCSLSCILGCVITGSFGSRNRRLADQFLFVKEEAKRLRDTTPGDLWLAIAPYERD